jgi:hypothetical protein
LIAAFRPLTLFVSDSLPKSVISAAFTSSGGSELGFKINHFI